MYKRQAQAAGSIRHGSSSSSEPDNHAISGVSANGPSNSKVYRLSLIHISEPTRPY